MVTPMRCLRKKCLDCSGDSFNQVKYCPCTNCAIWPYRFGVRPATIMADSKKRHLLRAELMTKTANMSGKAAEDYLKRNATKVADK